MRKQPIDEFIEDFFGREAAETFLGGYSAAELFFEEPEERPGLTGVFRVNYRVYTYENGVLIDSYVAEGWRNGDSSERSY